MRRRGGVAGTREGGSMAEDGKVEGSDADSGSRTIAFHYIKSNHFRVIHVDGAVGAMQPNGKGIHMAVYSDRVPVPVQQVYEISANQLGNQVSTIARQGVVREVEADLFMDLETAAVIAEWLRQRIEEMKKLRGE